MREMPQTSDYSIFAYRLSSLDHCKKYPLAVDNVFEYLMTDEGGGKRTLL